MCSLVGGILRTEGNAVEKARMNGLRREFWCEVLRKSAEMIHGRWHFRCTQRSSGAFGGATDGQSVEYVMRLLGTWSLMHSFSRLTPPPLRVKFLRSS